MKRLIAKVILFSYFGLITFGILEDIVLNSDEWLSSLTIFGLLAIMVVVLSLLIWAWHVLEDHTHDDKS